MENCGRYEETSVALLFSRNSDLKNDEDSREELEDLLGRSPSLQTRLRRRLQHPKHATPSSSSPSSSSAPQHRHHDHDHTHFLQTKCIIIICVNIVIINIISAATTSSSLFLIATTHTRNRNRHQQQQQSSHVTRRTHMSVSMGELPDNVTSTRRKKSPFSRALKSNSVSKAEIRAS